MVPQLNISGNVAPADRTQRRRAVEYGRLAMVNAFDAHDRLVALMSVITRPLSERSFVSTLFVQRWNKPLDDQLCSRRNRQFRERQANNVHRGAAVSAGHFVF